MDTSAGDGALFLSSNNTGLIGLQQIGGSTGVTNYANFGPIPLLTPKTTYYECQSSVTGAFSISMFEF
jgi:hypothetical protein